VKALALSLALFTALAAGTPNTASQGPNGQALYQQQCATCHGAAGVPAPAMAKALGIPTLDAAFLAKVSDDSVLAVMKNGAGKMRPFKDKLSADQMTAVAKYLRSSFGGK
jgi:mono/diheme cytochrome c family protein